MKFLGIISCLVCVGLQLVVANDQVTDDDGCFRAAVYEHVRLGSAHQNLDVFEDVAAKAKSEGARIVVFPENGIYEPPAIR